MDHRNHAISRVIGRRFSPFQKTDRARRDRPAQELITVWRACSASTSMSRVHALDQSQRFVHSPFTSPFHPCHLLPPRARRPGICGSRRAKIHQNRAPLPDSSEPQHHRELLHVYDPTVIPFSPQVELTVSAAPPGRHDCRRLSSHVAVLLEPLTVPSLPCARSCECY